MDEEEITDKQLEKEIIAITKNIERLRFPVNGINKKNYYALWMNKGKDIVCQKGQYPLIFHRDVYPFCLKIADEMQATVQRFDGAWGKAISGGLTFIEVYIIRVRKQRKLTRMEIANNELQKARIKLGGKSRVPTKQSKPEVGATDDLDMPSVSGTEYSPDGERQDTEMHELPGDNTVN
jgi:hypothetical protein